MNSKNQAIQITIVLYHVGVFMTYIHLLENLSGWLAAPLILLSIWVMICFFRDHEEGEAEKDKLIEEIKRLRSLEK